MTVSAFLMQLWTRRVGPTPPDMIAVLKKIDEKKPPKRG